MMHGHMSCTDVVVARSVRLMHMSPCLRMLGGVLGAIFTVCKSCCSTTDCWSLPGMCLSSVCCVLCCMRCDVLFPSILSLPADNVKINRFRQLHVEPVHWRRVLDVVIITIVTSTVSICLPYGEEGRQWAATGGGGDATHGMTRHGRHQRVFAYLCILYRSCSEWRSLAWIMSISR